MAAPPPYGNPYAGMDSNIGRLNAANAQMSSGNLHNPRTGNVHQSSSIPDDILAAIPTAPFPHLSSHAAEAFQNATAGPSIAALPTPYGNPSAGMHSNIDRMNIPTATNSQMSFGNIQIPRTESVHPSFSIPGDIFAAIPTAPFPHLSSYAAEAAQNETAGPSIRPLPTPAFCQIPAANTQYPAFARLSSGNVHQSSSIPAHNLATTPTAPPPSHLSSSAAESAQNETAGPSIAPLPTPASGQIPAANTRYPAVNGQLVCQILAANVAQAQLAHMLGQILAANPVFDQAAAHAFDQIVSQIRATDPLAMFGIGPVANPTENAASTVQTVSASGNIVHSHRISATQVNPLTGLPMAAGNTSGHAQSEGVPSSKV